MKTRFVISREDLSIALDKTAKALSAAPTDSVLKYFLIEAVSGGIWVSASDKIVTMSTFVDCHVGEAGKLLLPAAKGLELVKKAIGEMVVMGLTDDGSVSILAGKSRWNIKTRDAETYPETGVDGYEAEVHEVGMLELHPAIQSVRRAMSVSLSAYAQVSIKGGKVRASDGVWFQEAPLPGAKNLELGIPFVAVDDVLSFLARGKGIVKIYLTDSGVVVLRFDRDMLSFRQPSQKAPNMDKAFTAPLMTNKDDLTINRTDLKAAIGRVAITADNETLAISLSLSAATIDTVVVAARSRDGSWSEEPVKCKWVGDTRTVLLHKDYVQKALSAHAVEFVTLKLGPGNPSSPSPVLIQSVGVGTQGVLNQLRADLL